MIHADSSSSLPDALDRPVAAPPPMPPKALNGNTPPLAASASYSGLEDLSIWGTLLGLDAESYALTFFATQPTHGSLTWDAQWGSFTYTPTPNYFGEDSFQYWVFDGTDYSARATVNISLLAVNDTPGAQRGSAQAVEGAAALSGSLAGLVSDPDSSAFSFLAYYEPDGVSLNAQGLWSFDPAHPSYDALAAGATQTVTVVYQVSDGTLSTTGSFDWILTGTNDAPVASAQTFYGTEDRTISGTLTATDPDGDGVVFSGGTVSAGRVEITPSGQFNFTPAPNQAGNVSLQYSVSDGTLSSTGTVLLIVQALNDAPTARNLQVAAHESSFLLGGSLLSVAQDPDGESLSFSAGELPAGFSLLANGDWTFDTDAGAYQSMKAGEIRVLSVPFSVSDGALSANAVIELTLTGTNDAPLAGAYQLSGTEDQPVSGVLADVDVEGETLTYTVRTSTVAGGTVSLLSGGQFEFVPTPDFSGPAGFGYFVSDGLAVRAGSVQINVAAVNDVPLMSALGLRTPEDQSVSAVLLASDTEGTVLRFSLFQPPERGSVVLNATTGALTYTPNLDTHGADSFVVRVTDADDASSTARINVQVDPLNDAPRVTTQTLIVVEDQVRSAPLPVADPDRGDLLSYELIATGAHGRVSVDANSGVYTYTPDTNYAGPDAFTIRATDLSGASVMTSLAVQVQAVDDAPEISAAFSAAQGFTGAPVRLGSYVLSDRDGEAGLWTFRLQVQGANFASFAASAASGVALQGLGTDSLSATGSLSALNAWFAARPISLVGTSAGQHTLMATVLDPAHGDGLPALSATALTPLRLMAPDSVLTPTLTTATPTGGSTQAGLSSNLVLGFNIPVGATGQEVLLRDASGRIVETFVPGASVRALISGTTLTLDPTADLLPGRGYSLQLPAGALTGAGNGLNSAGAVLNFQATWLDPQDAKSAWYPMVEKLYLAYFGRAADPAGLSAAAALLMSAQAPTTVTQFLSAYDTNPTVRALMDSFGQSAESLALYAGASTQDMVTAVYWGLLNRAPDGGGLQFWSNAITAGVLGLPKVALNILAAAETYPTADGLTVAHKVSVAQAFTLALDTAAERAAYSGDAAAAVARATLSGVGRGTDPIAYQARVDDAVARLVSDTSLLLPTAGADLLTGSAGADFLLGLAGADVFVPGQGDDTIIGGSGVDIVRFAGPRAGYQVVQTAGEIRVSDAQVGRDGVDRLTEVEVLQFFDDQIDLRITTIGVAEL